MLIKNNALFFKHFGAHLVFILTVAVRQNATFWVAQPDPQGFRNIKSNGDGSSTVFHRITYLNFAINDATDRGAGRTFAHLTVLPPATLSS
jgi:hypothetical protein